MSDGKTNGGGGTALGNAGADAGTQGDGKGADVGTNGAAGSQTSTQTTGANAGAQQTDAQKAEAAAAELAAKPFSDAKHLKLREGLKLNDELMKAFGPLATKHGLSNAQVSALIEFNEDLAKQASDARTSALDAAAEKAVEALKKDPEIGGAKFEASMKLAGSALRKFGGAVDEKTGKSELVEFINTARLEDGSMLGDNALFARFLANVGKGIAEDQVGANRAGGAAKTAMTDPATFNAEMYPNSPELHAKKS